MYTNLKCCYSEDEHLLKVYVLALVFLLIYVCTYFLFISKVISLCVYEDFHFV